MNFEADDLLDRVDGWKFKLHEHLQTLTREQRAAFWQATLNEARGAGLVRREQKPTGKRLPKPTRRTTV
jgi:hypothetical protein